MLSVLHFGHKGAAALESNALSQFIHFHFNYFTSGLEIKTGL
jgi:hypothetical protein